MAQYTFPMTLNITLSGLPEGLTDAERAEIAENLAAQVESTVDLDLESLAENLDLAGDWSVAETVASASESGITEAKE